MDYETICNCFVAVFQHYKDDSVRQVFVVNKERNDFKEFVKFLRQNITNKEWHISYNGLAFDAQITQFILNNHKQLESLSSDRLTSEIYKYAQKVISKTEKEEFPDFAPYQLKIRQIDLFKLNHWDNKAKRSSLKWIQYSMDWDNVEEMPHPHNKPVETADQLEMVVRYCINDVKSTHKILVHSKEQIVLRQNLTKEYNIDLYSASEPKISKELFLHFLSQRLGWDKSDIKTLKTNRDYIILAECILPYIKFKLPEFQKMLDYFRTTVITSTKDGFKYTLDYKGVKTDYGLGGIHGATDPGVYEAKSGWTIMTSDVTSFYPNLAIKNKFHPAHLPKDEFCSLYEWIFEERKKIPKTDPKNYVYKLILNSTYGLTGDPNSFLYDPKMTMQITINGQLSLSLLYEMLTLGIPEAKPLMQNTDGLEMMIPDDKVSKYKEICEEWEKITQLSLEHDEYSKMIIADVNNYIAVYKNGKTKCKGRFEWEDLEKKKVSVFHKNKSFLIIPKAIYAYFVHGTKPEDYLAQDQNIYNYSAGVKVRGDWTMHKVEVVKGIPEAFKNLLPQEKEAYLKASKWSKINDTLWTHKEHKEPQEFNDAFKLAVEKEAMVEKTKVQRIVRYYISNRGCKLVKNHSDGREIQIESGQWMQKIINKIEPDKPFSEYDINFDYYLQQIYKEIEQITTYSPRSFIQLSLF